jgi:hypothetical protein
MDATVILQLWSLVAVESDPVATHTVAAIVGAFARRLHQILGCRNWAGREKLDVNGRMRRKIPQLWSEIFKNICAIHLRQMRNCLAGIIELSEAQLAGNCFFRSMESMEWTVAKGLKQKHKFAEFIA